MTSRNTLQQLPLGWYAEKGGYWAMNPGYDRPEYQGSTRVIHYECMFCHNAYPRIPEGHQEAGALQHPNQVVHPPRIFRRDHLSHFRVVQAFRRRVLNRQELARIGVVLHVAVSFDE